MPILKNSGKNKGDAGKIVGVLLPLQLHSYFSLYASAKGLTKTSIVVDELKNWSVKAQKHDTEDVLITELVVRIRDEWETVKEEKTITVFKRQLKHELIKKGISEMHIEIILKQII